MKFRFDDRVVTGAVQGIGRAIAGAFGDAGARVRTSEGLVEIQVVSIR